MPSKFFISSYSFESYNGHTKEVSVQVHSPSKDSPIKGKIVIKENGKTVQSRDIKSLKDFDSIKTSHEKPKKKHLK